MAAPTTVNPLQKLLEVASHELKNPLSVILVNAAVLARNGPVDDNRRVKAATRILSNVGRMNRMIGDLFDFALAKMELPIAYQAASLNLGDLASKATEELRMQSPSRPVQLDRSGDLRGRFDQERLLRALQTMLTTAHKFGQPSEPVLVRCVGTSYDDVEVVVEVVRNPAFGDHLSRLFESLEADEPFENDGLWIGLWVLRQTIAAHDGTLELVASLGDAIRFSVRLPKRAEQGSA